MESESPVLHSDPVVAMPVTRVAPKRKKWQVRGIAERQLISEVFKYTGSQLRYKGTYAEEAQRG
jgi:hypothetical protein